MKDAFLVVDDDRNVSELVQEGLSIIGLIPHAAFTVAEGRQKAEEVEPELIVCDIHLPDGSGIDLCKEFKAHPKLGRVPIILITGTYSKEEVKLRDRQKCAEAFLLKPFRMEDLIETARRLLGK